MVGSNGVAKGCRGADDDERRRHLQATKSVYEKIGAPNDQQKRTLVANATQCDVVMAESQLAFHSIRIWFP